ncbi:MAG TPA: Ig-like domain-containing protein [Planctomycetota bacterium]|nr:Ig-like domain-containing protein [Planctomycetota bacterium]
MTRCVIPITLALAACTSKHSAPQLQIVSLMPPPGALDVAPDSEVTVALAEDLDPASVAADQLLVRCAAGPIAGTTTWDGAAHAVRWHPTHPLPLGAKAAATLRGGVRTTAGTVISSDTAWSFQIRDGAFDAPLTLAVAAAGSESTACVAVDPANGNAAVVVGADVWSLAGGTPQHESISFVPQKVVASDDGSLCAAMGVTVSTASQFLYVMHTAVRDRDGVWREDQFPVATGNEVADPPELSGGHDMGFIIKSRAIYPIIGDHFFSGPRASLVPGWPDCFQTGPHGIASVAAIGEETVIVSRWDFGGATQWFAFDCRTPTPQVVRQWNQPFGRIVADHSGGILILTTDPTSMQLQRQLVDGTVTATQLLASGVTQQATAVAAGPGVGAAIRVDAGSGAGITFRLDGSATAGTPRAIALPIDPIASAGWSMVYAPAGELWLVARVRDAQQQQDTLQLWRQRADEPWQGPATLLPATGRALGRPGIAFDDAGEAVIAVPRSTPDEVVVLRSR